MTKIFYNKTTGDPAVFKNGANVSDWPNYQETKPAETADQVRAKRDALLVASDTMALADRITDSWKVYRQSLRDIPAQSGFPINVTWPLKP